MMENNKKPKIDYDFLDPMLMDQKDTAEYNYKNPFYIPVDGSELRFTKNKFLAESYKYVYIMCLKNNFNANKKNKRRIKLFFDIDSNETELIGQAELVTLLQGPFALVNQKNIRTGLVVINRETLKHFNHNLYDLNEKEIVYLMLETKESIVTESWLDLYTNGTCLDKFIEKKIFQSYYKINDKYLDDDLIKQINSLSDCKYWQDNNNCNLSINKAFENRKFNLTNFQKWNLPFDEIEKELQKLIMNIQQKKIITKESNYPKEITDSNAIDTNSNNKTSEMIKMTKYVDGSRSDHRSFFEIIEQDNLELRENEIEELLTNHALTEQQKYYLLCNLLVSKKYCHYVLKNIKIMKSNTKIFEKYAPIFRYVMGYAWVTFYMEESIKKNRIKQNDRFVLNLDTAYLLPVFPFDSTHPYLNPYFSCLVSDNLVKCKTNINGVQCNYEYQNGIVDLSEFKKRLNIFISGKEAINLLDGINWSNMVITGGIMSAILPKTNPLMALFKNTINPKAVLEEKELDRFYQEYYANSDVDIACNHNNIIDFIEHVRHIKMILTNNLNVNEKDIDVEPVKTLALYINSKLLKKKCENGEIPFKFDYIVTHKHNPWIKHFFYDLYLEQKKISNFKNKEILSDKLNDDYYFELLHYCQFDKMVLIINDISFETEITDNRTPESNSGLELVFSLKESNDFTGDIVFIKFSETLKFKLHSKHLKHAFEIFRINDKDFFSCISRFHLPCVRSYYNGDNCYMLPSAITAYQTLTNIDFKYFVGSRDPINIIDKYRKRGFGTIMNQIEIKQYLSYIIAVDNYKRAYGVKDTSEIKNIMGNINVDHDFFKPRKHLPEDYVPDPSISLVYKNVSNMSTSTCASKETKKKDKDNKLIDNQKTTEIADLLNYYKKKYNKYPNQFVEIRTINSIGNIEPYKPWMIDVAYEMLK